MESQPMASCKKCLPTEDELIAKSWLLTRQNWWYLLKLILVPVILVVVGQLLNVLILWLGSLADNGTVMAVVGILAAIITFLFMLVAIWGFFAFAFGVVHIENKMSLWQIYTRSAGRILPLIWTSLIIIALVVPGFAIFIIPGIILMVWFSLAQYICLDEGTWGLAAIWKSKELVRGYWWSVVARFMAVQALMMIVIYSMMYILGLGGAVLGLISAALGSVGAVISIIGLIIGYVIYLIVMLLLSIFAQVYMAQVYHGIKDTKGKVTVNESGVLNTVIVIWTILAIFVIPLIFIFSFAALGGILSSLDSAGLDNLLSLFGDKLNLLA